MTGETMSAEHVVGGYDALFPPLTRAAHRACLEHARLVNNEPWPTIESCLAFAALYGVPAADLAAFFGYLSYRDGNRTVWVDALAGDVSTHTARELATRDQARAFGFQCALIELSGGGRAH